MKVKDLTSTVLGGSGRADLNVRSKSAGDYFAYRCGPACVTHNFGDCEVVELRPDCVVDRTNGVIYQTITIVIN